MENKTEMESANLFASGIKDGIPVGLGYFAVAFALGITMKNAGITPLQGFLISALNNASAGEYAGVTMIAAHATLLETAMMVLTANARYLLMSTAFALKRSPKTKLWERVLMGFDLTDELFALGIRQKGYIAPKYYFGMMSVAIPGWAFGTMFGIIFGALLPARIVSALSVALFGMFLAVIIPETRNSRVIAVIVVCGFFFSWLASVLPGIREISEGVRMLVITIVISVIAALVHPVEEEENKA